MNMSLFGIQFSLDRSTGDTVAFLTDCIRAATQDDVQVSAILASEKFGATLAMSPDSRRKIEMTIDMQSDTGVIKFLKCRVGYARNETLDLLRQSMAGVNFLALVAVLLGSTDNFNVAQALETMMEESLSQENGNLSLPTAYQLSRLIGVLESRLVSVKFAENVIHWKNRYVRDVRVPENIRKELLRDGTALPTTKVIQHIVHTMRKLSRIGDAHLAVITASLSAPWIAAFTTWCLGVPPKVIIANGNILLDEQSPVTLILSGRGIEQEEVEVKIYCTGSSFTEILTGKVQDSRDPLRSVGMISMAVHSRESLQQLDFERGIEKTESLGYRAMKDALPAALYQVRELCWVETNSSGNFLNPFPTLKQIASVAKKYLSLEEVFELENPGLGHCIRDRPLARSWVSTQNTPVGSRVDLFASGIAPLVANILALSLFNQSLNDIMLWSGEPVPSGKTNLGSVALEILVSGKSKICGVEEVLDWALQLVRHNVGGRLYASTWLGSAFKGQVVFPKIFETNDVVDEGWLELYCIPGVVISDGRRKKVHHNISTLTDLFTVRSDYDVNEEPVTSVENFFDSETIIWTVEEQEDHLAVALGWSGGSDLLSPFDVLVALRRTIMIKRCPHEERRPSPHEGDAYFQGPTDDNMRATEREYPGGVTVFPIHRSTELRLLSLSSVAWRIHANDHRNPLVLVNRGACIACALTECRKRNCQYLLL